MHLALLALLFTACSCSVFRPAGLSPVQQHNAMVRIETTCDDQVYVGSGVLVDDDLVLTANHVVQCRLFPDLDVPIYVPPDKVVILATATLVVEAVPDYTSFEHDLARLRLGNHSLGAWFTPLRVGQPPTIGDRVCEVSGNPRVTYRCGEAQEAKPGHVGLGFMVEKGNSGSAIYNARGEIIGIVTSQIKCQGGEICAGQGTALAGHAWLVPE